MKELDIHGDKLDNLNDIGQLTNLEMLILRGPYINNIDFLNKNENLKLLAVRWLGRNADFSVLGELIDLEMLDITFTNLGLQ